MTASDRDIWELGWPQEAETGTSEAVLTLTFEWKEALGLKRPETTRNRELWA